MSWIALPFVWSSYEDGFAADVLHGADPRAFRL